jgi:hypothetical protein
VTLDGDAIVPGEVTFVSSVGQFRLAHGIYEFNFKAEKKGRSFCAGGKPISLGSVAWRVRPRPRSGAP